MSDLIERLRSGEPIPPAFLTTETQMVPQSLLNEAADALEQEQEISRTLQGHLVLRDKHIGQLEAALTQTG